MNIEDGPYEKTHQPIMQELSEFADLVGWHKNTGLVVK